MGELAQVQPKNVSGAPGDIQPRGADNDQQGFTSSLPPNAVFSSQPAADSTFCDSAPSAEPQPGLAACQGAEEDTLSQEISAQVARFLAGDGSMSEDDEEDSCDEDMDALLAAAGGGEQPPLAEAAEASTEIVNATPSPVHLAPAEPPKLEPPQSPAELANSSSSQVVPVAQEVAQTPLVDGNPTWGNVLRQAASNQHLPLKAGLQSPAQAQAPQMERAAAAPLPSAALAAKSQPALVLRMQAALAKSLSDKKKKQEAMAQQIQSASATAEAAAAAAAAAAATAQPLSPDLQAHQQQAQQVMSQQVHQAQMQQFMQLQQWYGHAGHTQGSLSMSAPMQTTPAGFSMQSGGNGASNMYEQDFNGTTPQTEETRELQSYQRGYALGEIMRLWKMPSDLSSCLKNASAQLKYSLEVLYLQNVTPTLNNIRDHLNQLGVKRTIKDNVMQIAAFQRDLFTLWVPLNFKACILLTDRPYSDAILPDYNSVFVTAMVTEQEQNFRKKLSDLLPSVVSRYYAIHNDLGDFSFVAAAAPASHPNPSGARACEAEEVCPRCLRYRQLCLCAVVKDPPQPATEANSAQWSYPETVPGQVRVALSQELAKPDSAKVGTPPVMDVEDDSAVLESNPADLNSLGATTTAAKRLAQIIEMKQSATLMIRNLPRNVKQKRLLKEIDGSGFADLYDFAYLPSSFGKGHEAQGMGYAFVNFEKVESGMEFALLWHGTRRFNMTKTDTPLTISCAEFQGKMANANRWSRKGCRVRNPDLRPFIKGPCDILEACLEEKEKEAKEKSKDADRDKEDAAGPTSVQALPVGQSNSGFRVAPPPGLPGPLPSGLQSPSECPAPLPSGLQPPPGLAAPEVVDTSSLQATLQTLHLASRLAAASPQNVHPLVGLKKTSSQNVQERLFWNGEQL